MSTSIFIRTYDADAAYHAQAMRSIEKFCTGFDRTVVVMAPPNEKNGYMVQQRDKCYADQLTDSDFILMMDSDTIITEPVTPESFMVDGKPIWLHTPWTPEMLEHPGTAAWFRCMRKFFGEDPPSEFMRRQGFMIPREVLQATREYCLTEHGMPLSHYILSRREFSEFNCLGFLAWKFFHDEIAWVDTSKEELPPLRLRQWWSHDPIEKNIEEIERILA